MGITNFFFSILESCLSVAFGMLFSSVGRFVTCTGILYEICFTSKCGRILIL
jgi:hypothetical protein